MKTIIYQYRDSRSQVEYCVKVQNVDSVKDEPYPPGGELRVMRNEKGQALAGPLVSEITSWVEIF